ncbi:hypothetical protein MES5069_390072 [Mesorhizobium escarrei]|uniref:Uncharacterized protein n=1 Tax=Mesorhizobium escarrei TaxID=666018 RepID=A0ABM9E493_9HYPH|nr:hypothetical protein MES5069_390072 [Mesorhizobium escarrei]
MTIMIHVAGAQPEDIIRGLFAAQAGVRQGWRHTRSGATARFVGVRRVSKWIGLRELHLYQCPLSATTKRRLQSHSCPCHRSSWPYGARLTP